MNELANEKLNDPNGPLYDLGVLLVHGIGQPARGDMLVRFGDTLCKWIGEWSTKSNRPNESRLDAKDESDGVQFELREAFIHPRGDNPEAPPQVELHLKRTYKAKTVDNAWLLAESWWPKSFITPRYRDLAWWGLLVSPWISASHCGAQVYLWWKQSLTRLHALPIVAPLLLVPIFVVPFLTLSVGYITISLCVACVVILLSLLFLILAILPIPHLRSALLTIQQRLLGTVGDSYVLVSSRIQEAAIVNHVLHDIRWMSGRCKRLAIVAHSQGAAITHLALRTGVLHESDPDQVLFLTFGSGLKKLEGLRCNETTVASHGWTVIVGLLTLLVCLYVVTFTNFDFPHLWSEITSGDDLHNKIAPVIFWLLIFLIGGGFVYGFLGALSFLRVYNFDSAHFNPAKCFGIGLKWIDYYASQDPVPNGPLFNEAPEYLRSIEVYNYSAPWSDHSTYLKNILRI